MAMITLPQDVLLFHILPRLPIKSTSRFMCVSKQLYSFLSSEMFKKMHTRHLDPHQNPDKLLVKSKSGISQRMFGTLDFEAPDSGLDPSRFRLPFDTEGKSIDFLTSFHGLVCVGIVMNIFEYFDFILWNPLTSEYKTLSKTNYHKDCYDRIWRAFGLFYSSCEDDYKLVCLAISNVNIYSLKSDSWRSINYPLEADDIHYLKGCLGSICLNGNLYFINYAKKKSVTRFNTNTEKFEVIEVPLLGSSYEYQNHATLMVQRGCLHYCSIMIDDGTTGFKETCIRLWKMVKDGCWNNVVTYHVDRYYIRSMMPLQVMSNGNFLMLYNVGNCTGRALYEVDMQRHSKEKEKWWRNAARALYEVVLQKHSKGKENKKLSIKKDKWCKLISMGVYDQVRYTETFVSPNQYIK